MIGCKFEMFSSGIVLSVASDSEKNDESVTKDFTSELNEKSKYWLFWSLWLKIQIPQTPIRSYLKFNENETAIYTLICIKINSFRCSARAVAASGRSYIYLCSYLLYVSSCSLIRQDLLRSKASGVDDPPLQLDWIIAFKIYFECCTAKEQKLMYFISQPLREHIIQPMHYVGKETLNSILYVFIIRNSHLEITTESLEWSPRNERHVLHQPLQN